MNDKTIGTLATEDASAAYMYAGCQGKHSAVVDAYERLRQSVIDFIAKLKK